MKGYQLNPNKDVVLKIIDAIYNKSGHCPCRISQQDINLCPCDDFINNQICKCKLFVKTEESNKEEN